MITLKKIDYNGQLIISTITILSVPFLYVYGFLIGLFIIGLWQILSAILNTRTFIHSGYRKQIRTYWTLCLTDLIILFLSWTAEKKLDTDYIQVFFWIAIGAAVLIAWFYLSIYKNLIDYFILRNELDGLTKSKH